MKTLHVPHQQGTYPIYIGRNLLQQYDLLPSHIHGTQVMLITNETVAPLYLDAVASCLNKYKTQHLILRDGEQYKSFETWRYILDNLVVNNYHRDSTLIALGGGVVGDTVGFAAACYHRGVNFIQIPTSLLAQVDSSIGGKTGINHPAGKNLIGAFYQPKAVIIDMNTLQTLPKREFKAGLTEIIKAALICDADLFAFIETQLEAILQQENSAIQHCIKRACEIKSDIVSQDEKEHGARLMQC